MWRSFRPGGLSISIHAPLVGSDYPKADSCCFHRNFNPRSPCGERPDYYRRPPEGEVYFNPRSPCGERHADADADMSNAAISIHAPLVGSDTQGFNDGTAIIYISIHAPLVGSDTISPHKICALRNFNPRSPCGERPAWDLRSWLPQQFQSTLPLWGATLFFAVISADGKISIHAPLVGSDLFIFSEGV